MTKKTADIVNTNMEVTINAGQAEVWQALTEQIGRWWPTECYVTKEGGRTFKLEAHAGGRMYEESDAGESLLWGTVTSVKAPNKLQAVGMSHPEWGGPTVLFWTWSLSAAEGGVTQLTFEESSLGVVTDEDVRGRSKAWRYIWHALKAHVDGSEIPKWTD